mmetsp:Transcript_26442/g.38313  ORF Transcript_26442/g.38313 Transcript_26442/m.38313 type:complete len:173 (-) Transcript_26442:101-619(-)
MVGIPKEVLDEIDHISNRVTIGAFSGIFLGAAIATYRGFPILRTSLTVAASCAMTGTACFITERAAYATLTSITKQDTENETMKVVASHSIGGLCGGGLSGYLFHKRPFAGMMLFAPIMITVALVEMEVDAYRKERIKDLLADRKSRQSLDSITKLQSQQRDSSRTRDAHPK